MKFNSCGNGSRRPMSRRTLLVGATVALGMPAILRSGFAETASDYPNRRLRVVVPFPPGATTDTLARLVGQRLESAWSQAVVIENLPGAGGLLGTSSVARADPDGYTFLLAASSYAILPSLLKSVPYDSERDFTSVSMLGNSPSLAIVTQKFPANTFKEFIEYAKTHEVFYGSSGVGTVNHIGAQLLAEHAGIKLTHVPYKGGSAAMNDILGGHLEMTFGALSGSYSFVQNGGARSIAVTGEKRSPVLPNVPTLIECGYPLQWAEWFALVAPAKTPHPIVNKVSTQLARVLADPDIEKRIPGIEAKPSTPDELDRFMKTEAARWGDAIRHLNIKIE